MAKVAEWCHNHPVMMLVCAPCVGVLAADGVELVLVLCGYWQ